MSIKSYSQFSICIFTLIISQICEKWYLMIVVYSVVCTHRNHFNICKQDDPSGGVSCLTDGDTETYWESDGMQGQHWIRLHMKRGSVVK